MSLLLLHLRRPQVDYFGVFEIGHGVKSTQKINLHIAYYFKDFLCWMSERHAHIYTIYSSPSLSLSLHI